MRVEGSVWMRKWKTKKVQSRMQFLLKVSSWIEHLERKSHMPML